MWTDLGRPVLVFILVSWVLLATLSIASSIMRRGAGTEWKQILRRWMDPHPQQDHKEKV